MNKHQILPFWRYFLTFSNFSFITFVFKKIKMKHIQFGRPLVMKFVLIQNAVFFI